MSEEQDLVLESEKLITKLNLHHPADSHNNSKDFEEPENVKNIRIQHEALISLWSDRLVKKLAGTQEEKSALIEMVKKTHEGYFPFGAGTGTYPNISDEQLDIFLIKVGGKERAKEILSHFHEIIKKDLRGGLTNLSRGRFDAVGHLILRTASSYVDSINFHPLRRQL